MNARLLRINPEPLKVVSDGRRDAWTRQQGFRCDHEDGRGRCSSHDTRSLMLSRDPLVIGSYCPRHFPREAVA